MKKLIILAGALIALSAIMESCGSPNKIPRPQRHPRPPKPMAMVTPATAPAAVTVVG